MWDKICPHFLLRPPVWAHRKNSLQTIDMKTLYYTILYRPQGCKSWLPVPEMWCYSGDRPRMNFFASLAQAHDTAAWMAINSPPVWLEGARHWASYEFKVGLVQIHSSLPDAKSPDPSPNLKPPTRAKSR